MDRARASGTEDQEHLAHALLPAVLRRETGASEPMRGALGSSLTDETVSSSPSYFLHAALQGWVLSIFSDVLACG